MAMAEGKEHGGAFAPECEMMKLVSAFDRYYFRRNDIHRAIKIRSHASVTHQRSLFSTSLTIIADNCIDLPRSDYAGFERGERTNRYLMNRKFTSAL